jgi:hypothetical protein
MKQTEYLVFAALLAPTVVVAVAAVFSLVAPVPDPEYHPPVRLTAAR